MPAATSGPVPLAVEDSVTRIATPAAVDARGIAQRFDKRTIVLIDGPNAGATAEYWQPITELATGGSSTGGLTDAQLRATAVPVSAAATDAALANIRRGLTDYEARLDYDARLDGNPVYVGKAANGTLTSAATWTIQKLTYDGTNRLTRAQVLVGIWDNRAALAW